MITVRQIDRLWSAKAFDRLLEQLISPRPESSDRLLSQLPGSLPAAAMAVIRLDELSQSFAPLYSQLVRTILSEQRPDGGWGDVMTTALCLRALLCGNGNGLAVERGLASLASLQKEQGIWPSMPVRRMPVDPYASAFVLLHLGSSEAFRNAVRVEDAKNWFDSNELALDEPARKLWSHACRRLPTRPRRTAASSTTVVKPDRNWKPRTNTLNPRHLFIAHH
jgi:hypothetical protein